MFHVDDIVITGTADFNDEGLLSIIPDDVGAVMLAFLERWSGLIVEPKGSLLEYVFHVSIASSASAL